MPSTKIPEDLKDLLDAQVASLTTLGRNGAPQSTLIWFVYDRESERFRISLAEGQHKTQNLLARPQVSLLVYDPTDQFRYIDVRGTASTEVDTDYAWADAHVTPKYGADVRNFGAPGVTRLVVTLEPTSVFSQNGPG